MNNLIYKGYNNLKELPISLFVFWPYCSRICPYCNFNKYRDSANVDHERMSKSLSNELRAFSNKYYNNDDIQMKRPISSIYFGGGTPSLAKISTFVETIETMRKQFPDMRIEDIEVTLEVNPDQKDLENTLKDFKKYVGVNRISLGVQSLINKDLEYLGRSHNVDQAVNSIQLAQRLFNHNVTFDLIYSRNSKQSKEEWRNELKDALYLTQGKGHLSLYTLTFEQGTSFHKRLSLKNSNSKKIIPPDHDTSSDLYQVTLEETQKHGFNQYEVSSFASSDSDKGKHNLNYWRGGDYIGIGPGSSSRITIPSNDSNMISRYAFKNISHPKDWMNKILLDTSPSSSGTTSSSSSSCFNNAFDESIGNSLIPLTNIEVAEELLLMGLRTIEGVKHSTFSFQTNGLKLNEFLNLKQVELFQNNGLLIYNENDSLKLTQNGIMLLDTIIPKIIK